MKKPRTIIGRWFESEKAVISHLKKKQKELEKAGLIVGEKWYGKFRVLCGANGFLLVGEELEYGMTDHKK